MIRFLARIWVVLLGLLMFGQLTAANTDYENGDLLASAFHAVGEEDWITAQHLASKISDPSGETLITWSRLRAGEGEFWEYREFLDLHRDWPGLKRLRARGETVLEERTLPKLVLEYFKNDLPQTGIGALHFANALQTLGRTAEARSELIRAWVNLPLTRDEESKFNENYEGITQPYHERRLQNLLWNGHKVEAARMLDRVSPALASLAKARIGLQRAQKNVDQLIEDVDPIYKNDPGLAYDRFQWRMKKDRWDEAAEMLSERTGDASFMGRPEKWSNRRRGFARRAMRAGDHNLAYLLASQHGLTAGSDYADLEWLSGYLSMTHLEAPEQALQHFQNFYRSVKTPISLGRAGFWLGRVYEELNQPREAEAAYGDAAEHQTSFYGQLAAEKGKIPSKLSLIESSPAPHWSEAEFSKSDVFRASKLLAFAQEEKMFRWFLTHLAEKMNTEELNSLSNFALELEQPYAAVGIAKQAAKIGIVLPSSYYPVTELAGYSVDVAPEIAMSIARRESELNPLAISPAGARGLMQIMPATARQVADDLDIEFSRARLTNDWRYNATLGTAYLGGLIELYEGSYVLAFAAYNAGPHRVDEWIETYGDPRDSLVDPIDWIEHIPFRETRNYVQRVIESLHIYRARLTGVAGEIQLTYDLTRG